VRDNLDGTYSTRFLLREGAELPKLTLHYGAPSLGRGIPLVRDPTHSRLRRVRVTLDRVQLLDLKDSLFGAPDRAIFDVIVAPNSIPGRGSRTRVPAKGQLRVGDKGEIEIGQLVFDDVVEADAHLGITMGGKDFDWLIFLLRRDRLVRYHRIVQLNDGVTKMAPDDEVNDPEHLNDWKVWYTVEVLRL
jgi:hypothetical protein